MTRDKQGSRRSNINSNQKRGRGQKIMKLMRKSRGKKKRRKKKKSYSVKHFLSLSFFFFSHPSPLWFQKAFDSKTPEASKREQKTDTTQKWVRLAGIKNTGSSVIPRCNTSGRKWLKVLAFVFVFVCLCGIHHHPGFVGWWRKTPSLSSSSGAASFIVVKRARCSLS